MEEENRKILEFCKAQQEREEQRMKMNKEMEEKKAMVQSKVYGSACIHVYMNTRYVYIYMYFFANY